MNMMEKKFNFIVELNEAAIQCSYAALSVILLQKKRIFSSRAWKSRVRDWDCRRDFIEKMLFKIDSVAIDWEVSKGERVRALMRAFHSIFQCKRIFSLEFKKPFYSFKDTCPPLLPIQQRIENESLSLRVPQTCYFFPMLNFRFILPHVCQIIWKSSIWESNRKLFCDFQN